MLKLQALHVQHHPLQRRRADLSLKDQSGVDVGPTAKRKNNLKWSVSSNLTLAALNIIRDARVGILLKVPYRVFPLFWEME